MPIAAIWAVLSKLPWKWIGLGLAILTAALLIWRAPWAEHRQAAKDAVAWNAEHARAEGFRANQDTLTAALNRQNAAVAALKVDGDKRVADGKTALAKAQRANAGLSDQANSLRKSAGRKIGADDPCVISNVLGNMGAI
jgi:hypothetical protein